MLLFIIMNDRDEPSYATYTKQLCLYMEYLTLRDQGGGLCLCQLELPKSKLPAVNNYVECQRRDQQLFASPASETGTQISIDHKSIHCHMRCNIADQR
jgi:hypothetical protein